MKIKLSALLSIALLLCFSAGCTNKQENTETPGIAGETFWNTTADVVQSEPAKVWFGKDGTFVLEDQHANGTDEISGSWTISKDVITLTAGEKKIIFEQKDEKTLVLKTTLAGSNPEDLFSTEYTPAPKPSAQPSEKPVINIVTPSPSPTPAVTAAPTAEPEDFAYYNANQDNPFGKSFLKLFADGTFTFTEVEGMGAIEINGVFGQEGNYLMFSNFDYVPENKKGEPVYNFEMEVYDEDTLILRKDTQSSKSGDVFSISGTIPAGYTDPAGVTTTWIYTPDPKWGVPQGLEPKLELFPDGTFVLTENCFSNMGQYSGWYEISADAYLCHVTDAASMKGFAGGDVTLITFKYDGGQTLTLMNDLCMSLIGDEFILQ